VNAEILKYTALIKLPDVLQLYPVSRSTWYQGIKLGKYPPPIKIGPRSSAWRLSDINKLIEDVGAEK
jgi:predicted DNA-binding transcriptional regulator AlpA